MKRVFKYELSGPKQIIRLPKGFLILSLKCQYGLPCLWALVDEYAEKQDVLFRTIGTGHDASCVSGMTYVDTFLINKDTMVFHVFYQQPPQACSTRIKKSKL